MQRLSNAIQRSWYGPNLLTWLLLPVSYLYRLLVWLRQKGYAVGLLKTQRLPIPVIVVGNITVGGTGKTPLVIWLCEYLKKKGWEPGVVSRGYGGNSGSDQRLVNAVSNPQSVGDEPVLIARRTKCPVCVGPDRVAAARRLLDELSCDIIISDDGLQHLALDRDIEIAVIDGERRSGNKYCLPAGPLREPVSRLNTVDVKVTNGKALASEHEMTLKMSDTLNLVDNSKRKALDEFRDKSIHAIAGIGNPDRFFFQLRQEGLNILAHAFPDHHDFTKTDLDFNDDLPILMTEKDAVKCTAFASENHWYVPVDAVLSEGFESELSGRVADLRTGHNA